MGGWTLLGDFKANRDKINFYNKHTDVLKRILDRHGEDKKIGQELMRNRVRQQKANNIAADGPDAPGLAEYASTNAGRSVAALGAQRILSREDRLRLERTKGNLRAAKELEVADQCQETIRSLTELAKERALRPDEERRFRDAQTDLVRAQEMLEVPEDSLAVDVWAPGADGVLGKTQFYTKAEAPEYLREHQARAAGEPPPPPPPRRGPGGRGGRRPRRRPAGLQRRRRRPALGRVRLGLPRRGPPRRTRPRRRTGGERPPIGGQKSLAAAGRLFLARGA